MPRISFEQFFCASGISCHVRTERGRRGTSRKVSADGEERSTGAGADAEREAPTDLEGEERGIIGEVLREGCCQEARVAQCRRRMPRHCCRRSRKASGTNRHASESTQKAPV